MKRLYHITWALVGLAFVVAAVFCILAPDIVPVHYNFAGEMDRMGSKYEFLVFPILTVPTELIMLLTAKLTGKSNEKGAALGERICLYTAIGLAVLFTGLEAYFMWLALTYTEGSAPSVPALPDLDWMRLTSVLLGVLLIVLGNFMPKARMNQFYGLRTRWSMSSDEVWRKCQRFGGFASVAAGALLLAASLFLPGGWNLLAQAAVLVLWVALCAAASYRYGKDAGTS